MFESLGCVVEQAEPDFEGADETFKTLRFAMSHLASVAFPDRMKNRDLVKDTILWETECGEKLTGSEVMLAEMKRTELFHRMRHFLEQYEFFVLPVSQVPPFDVHQHYPTEIAGVKMETYIDWMKSCYYISLTASPAISVPAGFTRGRPACWNSDCRPASRRLGRSPDGARVRAGARFGDDASGRYGNMKYFRCPSTGSRSG